MAAQTPITFANDSFGVINNIVGNNSFCNNINFRGISFGGNTFSADSHYDQVTDWDGVSFSSNNMAGIIDKFVNYSPSSDVTTVFGYNNISQSGTFSQSSLYESNFLVNRFDPWTSLFNMNNVASDMQGNSFENSTLNGVSRNFDSVDLINTTINVNKFSNVNIRRIIIDGSTFSQNNFSFARIAGGILNSDFLQNNFQGLSWNNISFDTLIFTGNNLTDINFQGSDFTNLDIENNIIIDWQTDEDTVLSNISIYNNQINGFYLIDVFNGGSSSCFIENNTITNLTLDTETYDIIDWENNIINATKYFNNISTTSQLYNNIINNGDFENNTYDPIDWEGNNLDSVSAYNNFGSGIILYNNNLNHSGITGSSFTAGGMAYNNFSNFEVNTGIFNSSGIAYSGNSSFLNSISNLNPIDGSFIIQTTWGYSGDLDASLYSFGSATDIYSSYSKELASSTSGIIKLIYYDDFFNQVIVAPDN